LHTIEDDRRGSGAAAMLDDVGAGAPAPGVELLDGGGAKGVRGDEQDFLAGRAVLCRELADRGGLADAVDAEKITTQGRADNGATSRWGDV
jgi:hypothetical protein